jgi:hypothetical protein
MLLLLLLLTSEMPAAHARSLAVPSGSCAMLMWRGASCFSSAATSSLRVPSPPPAMMVSYLQAIRRMQCGTALLELSQAADVLEHTVWFAWLHSQTLYSCFLGMCFHAHFMHD